VEHGTVNAYGNKGCRCNLCREAWRLYYHERKRTPQLLEKKRERQRKRYFQSTDKEKAYWKTQRAERRRANAQWVRDYKASNPCAECGNVFPYQVMDFHHLGKKKYNVSQMAANGHSLKKIQEEIAKCDLLCANCHRLKLLP